MKSIKKKKKSLVKGLVNSSGYNDSVIFEAGISSVAELVASCRAQHPLGIMQSLHCGSVSSKCFSNVAGLPSSVLAAVCSQ